MRIRSALDDIFVLSGYNEYLRDVVRQGDPDAEKWYQQDENKRGYQPGEPWQADQYGEKPKAGWVRTDKLVPYREHSGSQHPNSRQVIDSIKDDLATGKGFTSPIHFYLDDKTGKASINEGNHRLRAAEESGISHMPVVVHPMSSFFGDPPENMNRVPFTPKPFLGGKHHDQAYHPKEVFPQDWLHESDGGE